MCVCEVGNKWKGVCVCVGGGVIVPQAGIYLNDLNTLITLAF